MSAPAPVATTIVNSSTKSGAPPQIIQTIQSSASSSALYVRNVSQNGLNSQVLTLSSSNGASVSQTVGNGSNGSALNAKQIASFNNTTIIKKLSPTSAQTSASTVSGGNILTIPSPLSQSAKIIQQTPTITTKTVSLAVNTPSVASNEPAAASSSQAQADLSQPAPSTSPNTELLDSSIKSNASTDSLATLTSSSITKAVTDITQKTSESLSLENESSNNETGAGGTTSELDASPSMSEQLDKKEHLCYGNNKAMVECKRCGCFTHAECTFMKKLDNESGLVRLCSNCYQASEATSNLSDASTNNTNDNDDSNSNSNMMSK